jgi:hypothetical protein
MRWTGIADEFEALIISVLAVSIDERSKLGAPNNPRCRLTPLRTCLGLMGIGGPISGRSSDCMKSFASSSSSFAYADYRQGDGRRPRRGLFKKNGLDQTESIPGGNPVQEERATTRLPNRLPEYRYRSCKRRPNSVSAIASLSARTSNLSRPRTCRVQTSLSL